MSKSEAEIQPAPAETFERSPSVESGDHASVGASNTKKDPGEYEGLDPTLEKLWGRINVPHAFWAPYVAGMNSEYVDDAGTLGPDAFPSLKTWMYRAITLARLPKEEVRIIDIQPDGSKIDRGRAEWKRDELDPLLGIALPPGAGACRVIIGVPERGRFDRSFAVDVVNLSGERAKGILRPMEKRDFQSIRKPGFDLMRLRQMWSLKDMRWQPFCYPSFRAKPSEEMGKIDPESMVIKSRGQAIFAVQPSWVSVQTVPLEGDRFIVLCALPSRKMNPEAGPKPRLSFSDLKVTAEEQRNEKLPLVYTQLFQNGEHSYRETFEQLLLSEESATKNANGDHKLLCQLLLLDLFRAASDSWVRLMGDWDTTASSMDFSVFDFSPDALEIQANANTVVPLCYWMRELKDTAHHLLATLTLRYTLHSPSPQNAPPWLAEIEMDLQADMNHTLEGFQSLRERMLSTWAQVDANTKQATEKNLGRLTIITAIFLPLSYGADILGMQFRIRELHFILYDYLGLVVSSGLFLFLLYKVIPRSRLLFKYFFGGVSGPQKRTSQTKIVFSIITKGYFRAYGIYMLLLGWIVIVVSFLIGMIGDMPIAIEALKYGLPVVGGICICWVAFGFLLGGFMAFLQAMTGSKLV